MILIGDIFQKKYTVAPPPPPQAVAAEKQDAPREVAGGQIAKRESRAVADRCVNKKSVNKKSVNKKCINRDYTLLIIRN